MESMLDGNCNLCLRECSKNAFEEILFEQFLEAADFVFPFEMSVNLGSNQSKVCPSCVYTIMSFYDYAIQVKSNQESLSRLKTNIMNTSGESEAEELCLIEVDPLPVASDDCDYVIQRNYPEETSGTDHENEDAFGKETDENGSVPPEHSDNYPVRRRARTGPKIYCCNRCCESFCSKMLLKMHMKTHLHCKVCGVIIPDKMLLREHMKAMHKNDTRVMCDKCGKIVTKCNLKTHIATNHTTGPVDVVQCSFCSKSFHNSATLRSHIQAIHKEAGRTFPCDVCQRVYPTSRSLRGHKARVHVELKHCCNICRKQFKREVNFKEHMAAHTGVSLYNCDVCGHKFNSNANMYAHIKRKHPVEWNEKQKHRVLGRRREADRKSDSK